MKTVWKNKNIPVVLEIIYIGALLAFVVFSFYTFTKDNRQRILMQNDGFIEAATEQTAARVNELIRNAERDVDMIAYLYGSLMTEPEVDSEMLRDMTERSNFDYVEFISSDGMDLTADGRTADLSDREYFRQGMQGSSGKCVIYNSRITNETLLIFYTPFYYEDRIIGVLSGILRGDTLSEIFSAEYFGLQNGNYLLERDGSVIFSTGDSSGSGNLLASMKERNRLSEKDLEKLEQALENGSSTNFNYEGANGAGSAYVTALEDGDWMLLQNFSSVLTRDMAQSADSAGIRLELKLFAVFMAYLLYLAIKNWMQKKRLVSENQQMSRIVDAVPQLFTRFALVDYETDTYEYLEDKKSSALERGSYSDLIRFLDSKYIPGEGSGENMSVLIAPEYVKEHLTEDVPYLQFEYQIDMEGKRWENVSILCLKRKDGVPSNVLYAIQDVTALKEREMQIRMALQDASEAGRRPTGQNPISWPECPTISARP